MSMSSASACPAPLIEAGVRLHNGGRYADAVRHFDRILKLEPGNGLALWHIGRALLQLRQTNRAISAFRQAIAVRPAAAEPHFDLGLANLGAGDWVAAAGNFHAALALRPDWPEAWSSLGHVQGRLRRFAEAEASFERALALRPRDASTLNHLGIVRGAQGRPDLAVEYYFKALQIAPGLTEAWTNLGNALKMQNKVSEALFAYSQALRINPKNCAVKFNLANSRLLLGQLGRETWLNYEYRWVVLNESPRRKLPQPLWQGLEPLAGKSILLHCEQGLGDTLQFVRYAKVLAAQGATVHVGVQPPLKSLLATLAGAASVTTQGDPLPRFDYQCPLLSVPFALDTRLETIPAEIPYVHAPAEKISLWRNRLGSVRGRRVGIVWRGNPKHHNDANRSIPFDMFRPLLETAGCEFFPLQVGLTEAEAGAFAAHSTCTDVTDLIKDFTDTAAIIAELDLVIAVDTSVAHLAGAMGKPVWVLLPFSPDWRWLLDRADSPWYPTMRLFRQPAIGDWEAVLGSVRESLHQQGQAAVAA